jgi:hypothetical protein
MAGGSEVAWNPARLCGDTSQDGRGPTRAVAMITPESREL